MNKKIQLSFVTPIKKKKFCSPKAGVDITIYFTNQKEQSPKTT